MIISAAICEARGCSAFIKIIEWRYFVWGKEIWQLTLLINSLSRRFYFCPWCRQDGWRVLLFLWVNCGDWLRRPPHQPPLVSLGDIFFFKVKIANHWRRQRAPAIARVCKSHPIVMQIRSRHFRREVEEMSFRVFAALFTIGARRHHAFVDHFQDGTM